jgi:hypothetical protein
MVAGGTFAQNYPIPLRARPRIVLSFSAPLFLSGMLIGEK